MQLSISRIGSILSVRRFASGVSVRARIIAIAAIPVIGFLANGIAFMSGERDVDSAFDSVQQAAALADASQEFKAAIATMRVSAKDFVAQPSQQLIKSFETGHDVATKNLHLINESVAVAQRQNIAPFQQKLWELMANFTDLQKEQESLGFTDREGTRALMREAGTAVERIINEDMSWLGEADRDKLLFSLLVMRRYEAEYRLERLHLIWEAFFQEFRKFNEALDGIIAASVMKESLSDRVKAYASGFAQWNRAAENVHRLLATISLDSEQMLPEADKMIALAQQRATDASATLSASQKRTRNIIIGVGLAAVLFGLGFCWLLGRSITRPLNGLAGVMKRLADGDTSASIPATQAKDEIGAMARTVIVFRDNMLERERLTASQADAGRAREQRSETIATTIGRFERSVDQALSKLREAAQRLESTSTMLNGAADAVSAEAKDAEERATAASGNVTAAASSVEELAASIGEIASQATKSTDVAGRAVSEARRTAQTMNELGGAATRIGEVIGLIQAIAGQTNLLALNATIEAARAGAAGKGFAVVASEVKSLAGQTARATEEIAGQIGAIQSAAADAAQAIEQVNSIIEEMSGIAATVASTVEEQNSAVSNIAEGVNRASSEARSGAEAMGRVAGASDDARSNAADVKALADVLAVEAESLDAEVRRFLADVQAA
jgi:methyl-accepting chemotaxis protein